MSFIYLFLKHTHSGLRWFALFFLVGVVLNSGFRYFANREYRSLDQKMGLVTMSIIHVQLLLGLILYFISPKVIFSAQSMSNDLLRFFLVEHSSLMLLSIILITVGYIQSKKAQTMRAKHLRLFIFYGTGLLILLFSIPWPWRGLGGGWI